MILVLGSAGTIGLPVSTSLHRRNATVRAFVHTAASAERLQALGLTDVFVGDVRKTDDLHRALEGCQSVFFVMPPFSEDEFEVGRNVVAVAREAGVGHFVYNSVLHPQMSDMPHHAQKLLVEEELIKSGLDFTIVRPAMLMQNILNSWSGIRTEGVFPALSAANKKFALVDTDDLGEAIATVLTDEDLRNGTFDLSCRDSLTYDEMAAIFSEELARPVRVTEIDEDRRRSFAQSRQWTTYAVDTFLKMLQHYDAYGLPGANEMALAAILRREPHSYRSFVRRLIRS